MCLSAFLNQQFKAYIIFKFQGFWGGGQELNGNMSQLELSGKNGNRMNKVLWDQS